MYMSNFERDSFNVNQRMMRIERGAYLSKKELALREHAILFNFRGNLKIPTHFFFVISIFRLILATQSSSCKPIPIPEYTPPVYVSFTTPLDPYHDLPNLSSTAPCHILVTNRSASSSAHASMSDETAAVPKTAGPRSPDPRLAAFSGAMSGALASVATHPLDVVRTKLAVQRQVLDASRPPKYVGTFGTLGTVFREEGLRGLFRGITPAVMSYAPAAAVFFSTYSFLKARVPEVMLFGAGEIGSSSYAAGGAWATTCLLLNPLFVLKTKQQTQLARASRGEALKYSGLLSSLKVVVAEQGWRGLYAGTTAAMAGFPGAMMQMPLYEYLKGGSSGETPSHARVALSSAASASFVGVLMYPVEVVRLRLQAQNPSMGRGTQYEGIVHCFRNIWRTEGIRAFYRGLETMLIRTVPQSAIGLSCYETVLRISTAVKQVWDRRIEAK